MWEEAINGGGSLRGWGGLCRSLSAPGRRQEEMMEMGQQKPRTDTKSSL